MREKRGKRKRRAAAAGANGENAVAKTEEVERMCKGIITSDSVGTENETGGWHRGRTELFTASEDKDHIMFHNGLVLRTVNDDEDFIAIHNDLVEHDKYDGMEENKKKSSGTKRKRKHIHRNHVDCRHGDCKRNR